MFKFQDRIPDMQDVTDLFEYYRLCLRDVWNHCFWSDVALRTYASGEHYERIVPLLFQALVLERFEWPEGIEILSQDAQFTSIEKYLRLFRVVPALPTQADAVKTASIQLLSDTPWEYVYPQNPIAGRAGGGKPFSVLSSDIDMRFLNFFEWGALGYRDLRYYVTRIVSFPPQPDLIGREAIIDVEHANVLFDKASLVIP